MSLLEWNIDNPFESGLDRGVLYRYDHVNAQYEEGVAWDGLVSVTEKPSGAELTKKYADNQIYGKLRSVEEFNLSIECYNYPPEFYKCIGRRNVGTGARAEQQARSDFAFSYRTYRGDKTNAKKSYDIHIIYGCSANPSDTKRDIIGENQDMLMFSFDIETVPVPVTLDSTWSPTSHIILDSDVLSPAALTALENALYGKNAPSATSPTLLTPYEIATMISANP